MSKKSIIMQVMKFLIMQFSPISCYFIPLGSERSPQHSVLKRPLPMYLI
jgi:hypothetical protein